MRVNIDDVVVHIKLDGKACRDLIDELSEEVLLEKPHLGAILVKIHEAFADIGLTVGNSRGTRKDV